MEFSEKTKQGAEPTSVSLAFVTSSRADLISMLFQLFTTVWHLKGVKVILWNPKLKKNK